MTEVYRAAKPRILREIAGHQHVVIEASAGTGKTYTIEHLIVEMLLVQGATIDEILVVTFTDKATSELRWRVRRKLRELLETEVDDPDASGDDSWQVDDSARDRLRNALLRFDEAPISTIHGFCHRVLEEHAFQRGALFEQTAADERGLFGRAFKDVLPRKIATAPGLVSYLNAWLAAHSGTVDSLEALLFDVFRRHCSVQPKFDTERIEHVRERIASLEIDPETFKTSLKSLGVHANTSNALLRHFGNLQSAARDSPDTASFLAALANVKVEYLTSKLSDIAPTEGEAKALHDAVLDLADAAPSLSAALTQLFLTLVTERLSELKEECAEYDFQDMLALLAQTLEGPDGEELARMLRARYRCALVDEFQDTDDVQWRIFRRIFFDSGGKNSLYLIGDPKQAIYGFRGADIHVYLAARENVRKAGGRVLPLAQNYRSTRPLLKSLNRIFGEKETAPFFSGGITYEHPVEAGLPELRLADMAQEEVPPVTIFKLLWSEGGAAMREYRETLTSRIANEIAHLLEDGTGRLFLGLPGEEEVIQESEIFVLTRSARDGAEVGAALARLGIPHVYYKKEGLFQTDEAEDIRDVLLAIEEPTNRTRRYRAWITPFFGMTLPELTQCEDLPHDHPLIARLLDWTQLAERKNYEELFARIEEDTGIYRRELFLRENERTVANYAHIFEVLLQEVLRSRGSLRELISKLSAFMEERESSASEQARVQRLESESSAVQIMTMHGAKGLEASVVFVYGGFASPPSGDVNVYHENGTRNVWVGPLADAPQQVQDSVEQEQRAEDQRLLYVALTRAKGRIYLPYFPPYLDRSGKGGPKTKEILGNGAYKQLNDRLRLLLSMGDDTLTEVEEVACFRLLRARGDDQDSALNLKDWNPPPNLLTLGDDGDAFRTLAREHRPHIMTSYSRMSRKPLHTHAVPAGDRPRKAPNDLPGGARSGVFLHEVLERLDYKTLEATTQDEWQEAVEVLTFFRTIMARHGIGSNYRAHSQTLVYRALTTPIQLGDVRVESGLASVSPAVREADFVFPYPESSHPKLSDASKATTDTATFRIERGYVTGFVDLLFEHEGKVFFLDWKSDSLSDWEPSTLKSYVDASYSLQARLYTIAVVKMLKIASEKDYLSRFGGFLYCFLRGMDKDGAGVYFERPAWRQVLEWEKELLNRRAV